jgi:NAD(P)-dependent dehydrogenase (short-subunit alcohol dehydrogenase family)
MPGTLAGRVALVTGAGSGIGRAASVRLAEEGAEVLACSRTRGNVEATVAAVRAAGGDAHALVVDVADVDDVARLAAAVRERVDRLDVLVNSAGVDLADAPAVWETTDDEWATVLDVNVTGTFRICRALLPLMEAGGSIINLGSINSVVAWPENAAYSTSKGAVLQFTRALALDVAARGIRANCVCPGIIETPLTAQFLDAAEDPVALRAEYEAVAPLNRLGTAREVANCIAFLAGDESSFVTGSAMMVDGGTTASA